MKGRRGFTLIELLVVIAIIAILAAILFPVYSRVRKSAWASHCQSNFKQIANAVKLYMSDNDDTYPVQTVYAGDMEPFSSRVPLSPPDEGGNPQKCVVGANWVEALFGYADANEKGGSSLWRCPTASNGTVPESADSDSMGLVSYVFNGFLLGQPGGVVRNGASLMLSREVDKLIYAEIRPVGTNPEEPPSASNPPKSAFLTKSKDFYWAYADSLNDPCNPLLHNTGSHVLFADGHVKWFTAKVFGDTDDGSDTKQDSNGVYWSLDGKTIQVSP